MATLLGDSLHVEAMQLIYNGTRSADAAQARLAMDIIFEGSRRAGAAQFLDVLGWRFMEPRMTDSEQLFREVKVNSSYQKFIYNAIKLDMTEGG